jgi:hypothetical protein
MKTLAQRLFLVAALLLVASVGIDELADATQTRPDQRHRDRRTEIVVDVESQNYRQSLTVGASALFATCAATVSGTLVEPGILQLDAGRYRFSLTPSLGHHGKERIRGCLNDLTVERLRSSVVSMSDKPL